MKHFNSEGIFSFDTSMGPCCVAWTPQGIDVFELPGEDRERTEERCQSRTRGRDFVSKPPKEISALAARVKKHFSGKPQQFLDVPIDRSGFSAFALSVYGALQKVTPGRAVTYGELANLLGKPGSARAVGRAMATNPLPLLIPCHRVLPQDGSLGNFSSALGPVFKAKMLYKEGVVLDPRYKVGIDFLRRKDKAIRRIIDGVGPYLPQLGPREGNYNTLVQAIIHQQLSMKAGHTIAGRVRALTDGPGFPTPDEMETLEDGVLRGAGLSFQKISYIRDLAARVKSSELNLKRLARLPDEGVIDALTTVKGIGRWTAQMFLIFQLDRLDVLPVDDLGFRNGVQAAYGLDAPPTTAELETLGETWRPYRSMATWYFWQSLDAGGI